MNSSRFCYYQPGGGLTRCQSFESERWRQRTRKRVRCRQCECSLITVENPSFKSTKCLGCGKQMKTKGKTLEGIVFTNTNPRYAEKLDDPQGGDTTMLMQEVREVMTVNQEMTDERQSRWGFRCGWNLRMRITVKPEVRTNAMTSVLIRPHFFWRLSSQISFETLKENSMTRSSETRLKC